MMSLYTRLLKYIIPHTSSIFLALLCAVVIAVCEMAYVYILADTVDVLIDIVDALKQTENEAERPIDSEKLGRAQSNATGQATATTVSYFQFKRFKGLKYTIETESDALRLVFMVIAGIFTLVFVKGIFAYGNVYLMSRVGYKVVIQFRKEMYNKIILSPWGLLNRQTTGDLMARIIDDGRNLQSCIISTNSMLRAVVILIVFLTMMFIQSWKLTLLTLLVFPSLGYLISKFGNKIRTASSQIQNKMADISSRVQETIFGIQVIKSFTAEKQEIQRFVEENQQQYRVFMKRVRLRALLTPLIELISAIGIACAFGLSCWLVIRGELTTGWFVGYIAMVGRVFNPIKTLGNFNSTLQQTLASAERIFYVLDFSQETTDDFDIPLPEIAGEVEFRNVSFGYDKGNPVLQNINFKVRSGETVALVGHSGVGKTTIFNILLRFYKITEGEILIDGYPISQMTLSSLRRQIALVPQDTILFSGTVLENIRYGRQDATIQEVMKAAQQSNAHDFIIQLAEGYETPIGERGVLLSGGQQQRIAIARAILKDPKILLLDEATSSLDSESEALVHESLAYLMKNRTTFVIAHRLSTVIHADHIFVLHKNKIVESGTHQQLIAQNGLYRKLCATQLNGKRKTENGKWKKKTVG